MSYKSIIVAGCMLVVASGAWAQDKPKTTNSQLEDDAKQANATFIFDEAQLGEDDDAAKATTLVSNQNDPYLKEVGYTFSAMRFKLRAYDSQYSGNYFNGVKLNNIENGRFSFSGMTGGLNDVVRNQEGLMPFDRNDWGYVTMGGGTNTNLRASTYRAGHKIGLAATNRNYILRAQYTYASGLNKNGWAFVAGLAYRWGKEGAIEGTFYNSFSAMFGVEKVFNEKHRLSLNLWAAPTERGQQGAATEEAYWLAGSHYYNPYWGYQNGKMRNSRVVTECSPTALMTWDFTPNKKSKLTTTAAVSYIMYGSTALSYNNAYNPLPTYYKNFPSSVVNMYSDGSGLGNNPETWNNNPGLLDQYNELRAMWGTSAGRQVKWDDLYAQNLANNQYGKDALYYQEERHNDQLAFRLSSVWSQDFKDQHLNLGIHINSTKGMHYKTMKDMLGASQFHDYDSYSVSEYGYGSRQVQNDLDNPDRSIKKGDIFGYNYNIFVNKAQAFTNYSIVKGGFAAIISADVEGTTIEREGLMRNGRAADFSKGLSGQAMFLGGGGKLQLSYTAGNHRFAIAGGYESQAPIAYNAFVASRIQNNFVNNLKNEQILTAQASWQWRFGPVSGKFTGFITRNWDVTQQSVAYLDPIGNVAGSDRFSYLTMTGVEKRFWGVEGAVTIKITDNLKFNAIGTYSDAKYHGNPLAQLAYEGDNPTTTAAMNVWQNPVNGQSQPLRVIYHGMRVSSTPLTAVSLGLDYNINGWYFEVKANYFDRVYIDASPYTRLGSVLDANGSEAGRENVDYFVYDKDAVVVAGAPSVFAQAEAQGGNVYEKGTGNLLASYAPSQEKATGGWMFDFSIGHQFRLNRGKVLNVNLQLNNFTNNTNMKTGGYEQNRTKENSPYKFKNNSFYWYANSINAFLNVNLRF